MGAPPLRRSPADLTLIGFILAHVLHTLPAKGQKKWRGMLLVPWVIPPAISTLAWWWLFDPSYSAVNWLLMTVGVPPVAWLGEPSWARFSLLFASTCSRFSCALKLSTRSETTRRTRPFASSRSVVSSPGARA